MASYSPEIAAYAAARAVGPMKNRQHKVPEFAVARAETENAGLLGRRSWRSTQQCNYLNLKNVAGSTRLELATSGVTVVPVAH